MKKWEMLCASKVMGSLENLIHFHDELLRSSWIFSHETRKKAEGTLSNVKAETTLAVSSLDLRISENYMLSRLETQTGFVAIM